MCGSGSSATTHRSISSASTPITLNPSDSAVNSTPTFIINGQVLRGALSYDQLNAAVTAAAERAGADTEVTKRMAIAALALAGVFIALYLTLHRLGLFGGGELVCAVGSCDLVNQSRWAVFLGLPVAFWGLGFYTILTWRPRSCLCSDRFADSLAASQCCW
jgi:hypothetical protein